jgi:hypothetical protein
MQSLRSEALKKMTEAKRKLPQIDWTELRQKTADFRQEDEDDAKYRQTWEKQLA